MRYELQFPYVLYDVEDYERKTSVVLQSQEEYDSIIDRDGEDRWLKYLEAVELQDAVTAKIAESETPIIEGSTVVSEPITEEFISDVSTTGTVMVKARCRKITATSPEQIEALIAKGYRIDDSIRTN